MGLAPHPDSCLPEAFLPRACSSWPQSLSSLQEGSGGDWDVGMSCHISSPLLRPFLQSDFSSSKFPSASTQPLRHDSGKDHLGVLVG